MSPPLGGQGEAPPLHGHPCPRRRRAPPKDRITLVYAHCGDLKLKWSVAEVMVVVVVVGGRSYLRLRMSLGRKESQNRKKKP